VRFFCEWWWLRLFPFQQLREASELGLEGSIAQYDPLCSRYSIPMDEMETSRNIQPPPLGRPLN